MSTSTPRAPHRRAGAVVAALATLALTSTALAGSAVAASAAPVTGEQAVGLVNPFIGSQGDGNTFPGAVAPFGMAQPSPDTGHNTGYAYDEDHIRGFSMVHISGVGCGLGGDLPILPTTGVPTTGDYASYALPYSHTGEEASPGYYGVELTAPGGPVRAELTATTRTGWQRYTFPAGSDATVLVNTGQALHAVTSSQATVVDDRTVETTVTGQGFCQSTTPYTLHFVTRFSRPFATTGTWAGSAFTPGSRATEGSGLRGAWFGFDTSSDRTVTATTSLSYVDAAGAEKNLAAEGTGDFDSVHAATRSAWAQRLGQVETTGGAADDLGPFYSSLYRSFITPSVGSDVDGRYLGHDSRPHQADGAAYYQNFSLWDTYRTQVQLLAMLAPKESRDQAVSLLRAGQQGGWAPRWQYGPVETNIMTGDPVTPWLVTAWQYGLLDGHASEVYRLLKQNADQVPPASNPANGRVGNPSYIANGYVPLVDGASGKPGDFDLAHGASATMEYAVADCTLSLLADGLGKTDDAQRYALRSRDWRSLLDPTTRFPRARDTDGVFVGSADPALSPGFHEGTAWQYQWLVPQDMPGLVKAMGGADVANGRLDAFFDYDELLTDPQRVTREVWVNSAYSYYGQSHYNPQNEPDLHSPYVYLWTGQPWKTADVVRAATTLFTNGPTGMTGNDDLGTMSAWHVLSSIGIYPAVAGTQTLVLGSPKFTKTVLHLPKPWFSGDVTISAPDSSASNRYVQSASLGGSPLRTSWFTADDLRHGATLDVALGSTPSTWATKPGQAPPSPCASTGPGTLTNLSLGLTATSPSSVAAAGTAQQVAVRADVVLQKAGRATVAVAASAAAPLRVTPSQAGATLVSRGTPATTSVTLHVTVPKGTRAGTYPVTVTASSAVGDVTRTLPVTVVDATCSAAGSSCPVDLGATLDLDGVATAATKTQGSFDGQGWSFPADQLPAPGVQVLGTQAFRVPDTSGTAPNFVAPAGTAATLPVAGRFSSLTMLASARNGDAADVPVVLHYADGDVATTVSVTDWAAGSGRFGETTLVSTTGRVDAHADSGMDGLSVHLWGVTVPTDAARTLQSVTLGPDDRVAVMAVTGTHA
ncbi:GH92 family glycosyl hydrolase [Lapillicoccus jejuensis]|uniref:Putative alpha-1,2-mannosidase n=1 Tax=Lapillicoccus jejuensis TaxID=402171 RepID=A0A542E240_9MICO|nr:GH92 family glycosyl hydrolase [Lapillicoccus jejuensis]TQJ09400.1 putative alpha-1,2-mannosidase [Lapillicoccus jejuensis]